jgi:hypothetical protein
MTRNNPFLKIRDQLERRLSEATVVLDDKPLRDDRPELWQSRSEKIAQPGDFKNMFCRQDGANHSPLQTGFLLIKRHYPILRRRNR